jgi:DNA-binding transcriptional MocR family regulator
VGYLPQLPPGRSEAAVVAAAAGHGPAVEGASTMRPGRATRPECPALVLGYATLADRAVPEAAGLLADALADAR